ncbi:TPA: hypothetical protein HA244_00945 [Candidatus Micrarchaeota archaeon]|nr:hypothetical protein [Candidatus Micrarchaeota archaeon]
MSEQLLKALVKKLLTTPKENIIITEYCKKSGGEAGINVDEALSKFLSFNPRWSFSTHEGEKGRRVESYYRLSPRRAWLGVFEFGGPIFLVNVMPINTRKQKLIDKLYIRSEDAHVV